ncbi:MAG: glycosyltransferase, partial [Methylococcaceae bacterium]
MRVSLIISTYNKPAYLEQVFESILQLNNYPDEVIVADDGSTSETAHLIERYQSGFPVPLIHVWQEDKGF